VSTEGERYFSRSEAEALLPELDELLQRAQRLLSQLEREAGKEPMGGPVNGYVRRNGAPQRPPAAGALPDQLREVIAEIQRQCVIVRDLRVGLIDFPALHEGTVVFLCWKRGEPRRIEWWHPTSTGIAGRRRLP
jgi:hypothetical protein